MDTVGQARRALPTGTVTFLFTDIEGSTERWERYRVELGDAVGQHEFAVRRYGELKRFLGHRLLAPMHAGGAMNDELAIEEAMRV